MSDTRRYVQPGWNPDHPSWPFGDISPKEQQRDRSNSGRHRNRGKRHAFTNGVRNCLYNLKRKVDALRLREEMNDASI